MKKTVQIDLKQAFQAHQKAIESVMESSQLLTEVVDKMILALNNGSKVLWMGNGGSAAEAQHIVAELMVRYVKNRQPLASIALTTDTSLLTAHTNDYQFETVFSRQIEALANPGDLVIGLSTSGTSANVLAAMKVAKQRQCVTIAMTGKAQTELSEMVDFCFSVDAIETARIQEAHTFINHLICQGLDDYYGNLQA